MALNIFNFLKGRTALKSVKNLSPETTEILLQAAVALRNGDPQAAIHAYSAAIQREPHHAETYYKRANACNALGRWQTALADFDKAIDLDPDHAAAFCNRGTVLEHLGRPDEALRSYDRALGLEPDDFLTHYNRGSALKELKRFDDALSSYDRAIALNKAWADAYVNRANLLRELHRHEASIASYDQALSLSPAGLLAHVSHVGRGLALAELTRYEEAVASFDDAITLNSSDFRVHANRGLALKKLQRLQQALVSFEQVIVLKSDYAEGHFYRGQVLQEMRQFEAAIASFDKAIAFTPVVLSPYVAHASRGFALAALTRFDEALTAFELAIALKSDYVEAYCARGHVFQELRRYEEAVASYAEAIAVATTDAQAHRAYCGRGFALKNMKRLDEALESYDRAVEIKDDEAEVYLNRGCVMQELGYHDAAVSSFDQAVALNAGLVEAFQGRALSLLNRGRHQEAIASFDQALALRPEQKYLQGYRRYVQMQICDWHDLDPYLERLERDLRARTPVSAPFQVLALVDSPLLHRLAAEIWVGEEFQPDDALGPIPPRPPGDKVRLGYFSADFRHHPVALLTAELFELHDRSRFEVIGFAFGPRVSDAVRTRLERAFDRFIDAGELSDLDMARTARALGVDIAVDLGGFTEFARPKVFSLRAAPIQISYIGYLGTMGAPYMDYLLTDSAIIPAHARQFYVEELIYLPSYQVNDSKRPTVDRSLTREELGLPATGFVFSCFNSNFKIMPATFAAWMRILQRVADSSLFLYAGSEIAEQNLRNEARRLGIDPRRIIFGKYLPREDYLARFRTMDLFLDTLPYNAGTTASDALWAGLPVLTCAGRAFAGRVAASLLHAIGLPQLVTPTIEEYEDLAVEIATTPHLLSEIREKLRQNRLTTALFDTRAFTRHLEKAFMTVQQRQCSGLQPKTMVVSRIC